MIGCPEWAGFHRKRNALAACCVLDLRKEHEARPPGRGSMACGHGAAMRLRPVGSRSPRESPSAQAHGLDRRPPRRPAPGRTGARRPAPPCQGRGERTPPSHPPQAVRPALPMFRPALTRACNTTAPSRNRSPCGWVIPRPAYRLAPLSPAVPHELAEQGQRAPAPTTRERTRDP